MPKMLHRLWGLFNQADSAWGFVTSDLVKPWLYPVLVWAITMLLALFHNVPLPYLFSAACVAAGGVSTALLRIDEWWERINPNGKIGFKQGLVSVDLENRDGKRWLKNVQFGFEITNAAGYELAWHVDHVRTNFNRRLPKQDINSKLTFSIPPHGLAWFRDEMISVEKLIEDLPVDGEVEFAISYWKSDRRKFPLQRRLKVTAIYIPDTNDITFLWAEA